MKMGQIFKEDEVIPITLISLESDASFEIGEKIKVRGTVKGRGFQGVVKRHGFKGMPKSHGTKDTHRKGGSIGATGPQRVFPGLKMPGRMGGNNITVKNLEVVGFDADRNLLMLRGAVPGNRGGALEIYPIENKEQKQE